jgi:hypothetical protein
MYLKNDKFFDFVWDSEGETTLDMAIAMAPVDMDHAIQLRKEIESMLFEDEYNLKIKLFAEEFKIWAKAYAV